MSDNLVPDLFLKKIAYKDLVAAQATRVDLCLCRLC